MNSRSLIPRKVVPVQTLNMSLENPRDRSDGKNEEFGLKE